jgi:hypothetical protein
MDTITKPSLPTNANRVLDKIGEDMFKFFVECQNNKKNVNVHL